MKIQQNQPSFGMQIHGQAKINLALIQNNSNAIRHWMESTESHLDKKIKLDRVTVEFEKLKKIANSAMESITKYNKEDAEIKPKAVIDGVKVVKNPLNNDLQMNLNINNQVFIPLNREDSNIAEKIKREVNESNIRLN